MHTWHWQTWEEMSYLTCSLLEAWPHGFFTQHFWPRSPEELTMVLHPDASGYRLKQVHGNTVLTPSEIATQLLSTDDGVDQEDNCVLASADGLVSEQPLQALWVASADCTPVLIADEKTLQVAAIHAGWRGTAAKIVPQAIARLQAQGSKIEDLRIAMGPAIAGEVYQVSTQVAAQVGMTIIPHDDENAIVEALHELPNSPLFPDPNPGKFRLDVRRINFLQMEKLGVSPEQIAIAPYCTYQTPEHFFSYRREKQKKVQWSGIVSR
ncbi:MULTISPECIES: peptidoglycan editing factor PgeF [Fischerella]|jgi:YfiH family protein|uniref:Purine nucleoside phosphorylase n=1 Tax=Fischerella muscicola CCMEE 5323 TaxID=2019572 RepID=A0A2N6K414_FISMU|nr:MULTISPECIES: peptidoglycan editing factor PgeF [Fischerella]MBD2433384.1 peptidoglycan editing factor PgeF [Fischerella sp. FACHB-380]PLZ90615.1 laccase [Fischerella muscicola CCMEE 5323]PMB53270.1 laccase [Fischerella thermalis CCMEE 5201]